MDLASATAFWFYSDNSLPKWDRTCADKTAVVVFFGGENEQTRARSEAARQALVECPAMLGFLVGGSRPQRAFWGAELMKARLVDAGIAASRLTSERRSYDSRGNLKEMFNMAQSFGVERLILVSDAPHLYRLLFLARGGEAEITLETISANPTNDPSAIFWRPHYEALAWLVGLLPNAFYDQVLRTLRS